MQDSKAHPWVYGLRRTKRNTPCTGAFQGVFLQWRHITRNACRHHTVLCMLRLKPEVAFLYVSSLCMVVVESRPLWLLMGSGAAERANRVGGGGLTPSGSHGRSQSTRHCLSVLDSVPVGLQRPEELPSRHISQLETRLQRHTDHVHHGLRKYRLFVALFKGARIFSHKNGTCSL